MATCSQCTPSLVRKSRLGSVHIVGMSCGHVQMLLKKSSTKPSLSKSAATTVRIGDGRAIAAGAASV